MQNIIFILKYPCRNGCKMKRILVLLSLILFFIIGLFTVSGTFFSEDIKVNESIKHQQISAQQVLDIVNDGTIQSYSLTDEHHFLSKNEDGNRFNFINTLFESHIGNINAKRFLAFNIFVTLPHSYYILWAVLPDL